MKRLLISTAVSTPPPASSSFLRVAKRRYVNALFRMPVQGVIPTHNKDNEEIDVDKFMNNFTNLFNTIRATQLIDKMHEMRESPNFDSIFVSELIVGLRDFNLLMPKLGREHRSSEISEVVRYCRGAGMTGMLYTTLQEAPGCRADGGDFLQIPNGCICGLERTRTNALAARIMNSSVDNSTGVKDPLKDFDQDVGNIQHQEITPLFPVRCFWLLDGSPPLGDIVHFAGARTLFYQDNKFGRHAVEQIIKLQMGLPWQSIPIESGCHILSHTCPTNVFDVIVDEDFPQSVEAVGEAGFQPHVCNWSEARKLGISMRSVVLIMRFTKGHMNAGGFRSMRGHLTTTSKYQPKRQTLGPRKGAANTPRGDQGSPHFAMFNTDKWDEIPEQSIPRYRPPMHLQGGALVPVGGAGGADGGAAPGSIEPSKTEPNPIRMPNPFKIGQFDAMGMNRSQ